MPFPQRLSFVLIVVILAVTWPSLTAKSDHHRLIDSEFDSLKTNIKLLRNRSQQLHAKNTEFKSRTENSLTSLKRRENDDNAAIHSISGHMRKGLVNIAEEVDRRFSHRT